MRRIQYFHIIITSLLMITGANAQENNHESLDKVYVQDCAGQQLEILVPKLFYTTEIVEKEGGYIKSFIFPNQERIVVSCIDNTKSDKEQGLLYFQRSENSYTRSERINGIPVFYINVGAKSKDKFDRAFDNMIN